MCLVVNPCSRLLITSSKHTDSELTRSELIGHQSHPINKLGEELDGCVGHLVLGFNIILSPMCDVCKEVHDKTLLFLVA